MIWVKPEFNEFLGIKSAIWHNFQGPREAKNSFESAEQYDYDMMPLCIWIGERGGASIVKVMIPENIQSNQLIKYPSFLKHKNI